MTRHDAHRIAKPACFARGNLSPVGIKIACRVLHVEGDCFPVFKVAVLVQAAIICLHYHVLGQQRPEPDLGYNLKLLAHTPFETIPGNYLLNGNLMPPGHQLLPPYRKFFRASKVVAA